jgi:hypothetical protein
MNVLIEMTLLVRCWLSKMSSCFTCLLYHTMGASMIVHWLTLTLRTSIPVLEFYKPDSFFSESRMLGIKLTKWLHW